MIAFNKCWSLVLSWSILSFYNQNMVVDEYNLAELRPMSDVLENIMYIFFTL